MYTLHISNSLTIRKLLTEGKCQATLGISESCTARAPPARLVGWGLAPARGAGSGSCTLQEGPQLSQLATTYERDGYDGTRGDAVWWFEAWGYGPKHNWTRRTEAGRPPSPRELRQSDYIVIGMRSHGTTIYRTHVGGLDRDPRVRRRPRRGR